MTPVVTECEISDSEDEKEEEEESMHHGHKTSNAPWNRPSAAAGGEEGGMGQWRGEAWDEGGSFAWGSVADTSAGDASLFRER